MTKGHLFGPHVSQSIPCWGLSRGVALWTVAADNPTLCELAPPHNGSIVESHSPGRRDWVYVRWQRGVGSGGPSSGAPATMSEPKKGWILMISWQWYLQWEKGNICCFPHGSSADHTLCPHASHQCKRSNPSWLWSDLWKQVSNQSCCQSDFFYF